MSSSAALINAEIQTLDELRLERARHGFLNFVCYTKPDYEVSWFHRTMAKHLNKLMAGEIKRLIITLPPRHGKSELCSVRLPAYALGRDPNAQVICATYNADYAKKINRDVQRVFEDPAYKRVFPESKLNEKNVRTISGAAIRNSEMFEILPPYRGFYKATSIGGPLTGFGGSLMICDDFCKDYDQAKSLAYRESVWDWWATTFSTRALRDCRMIICATRWLEDDLIGRLLEQSKRPGASSWTLLNLPALCETPKHPDDPRQEGDALWPSHYPVKWLKEQRSISERAFIAMYQARPAPQSGNLIRTSWWKYWTELPEDLDLLVASADLSFNNDTGREDFTVFTVWGRSGVNYYLLDMIRDRMNWRQQKAAMVRIANEYPDLNAFYIEKAALGEALISEARQVMSGVVAVTPKGGKGTRLEAVAGLIEAGNVWLPHPEKTGLTFAPLVVAECGVFPNGKNDDICFAAGTLVATPRGDRPIETIRPGDWVLSPAGYCVVEAAECTGEHQTLTRFGVTATPNHPFATDNGFVRFDTMTQAMAHRIEWKSLVRWAGHRQSILRARRIGSWAARDATICRNPNRTQEGDRQKGCMWPSGSLSAVKKCRATIRCITRTAIHLTILLAIFGAYRLTSIVVSHRPGGNGARKTAGTTSTILSKSGLLQASGIDRQKDAPGTASMPKERVRPSLRLRAWAAMRSLPLRICQLLTVHPVASCAWQVRTAAAGPSTSVSSVPLHLSVSVTARPAASHPPARAPAVPNSLSKEPVYCLKTSDGVFFANGLLVSNCDSLSQALGQMRRQTASFVLGDMGLEKESALAGLKRV